MGKRGREAGKLGSLEARRKKAERIGHGAASGPWGLCPGGREERIGHSVMEEWVMGSTEEGVKRAGSASGIQRRSNRDARYTFKDFY